jgi:hypothetical protein
VSEAAASTAKGNIAKIDIQMTDLKKKLSIEKKVKSGAQSMAKMLKDKNARAEIEYSISESQKRLDFLEGELQKLLVRRNGEEQVLQLNTMSTSPTAATSSSSGSSGKIVGGGGDKRKSSVDNLGKLISKGGSGLFGKLGFSSNKLSNTSGSSTATLSNGGGSSVNTTQIIGAPGGASLKRSDSNATQGTTATASRKMYNNLDMSKADAGLTPEKIAYKIASIKSKIEVETRVKSGAEKMMQIFEGRNNLSGQDQKAKDEVVLKLKDSGSKIALLKTALQRYQGMHIEGLANTDGIHPSIHISFLYCFYFVHLFIFDRYG